MHIVYQFDNGSTLLTLLRPKRNLLLFPVTRPTRQKAADSVNFMALKKKKKKKKKKNIYIFFFFFFFLFFSSIIVNPL